MKKINFNTLLILIFSSVVIISCNNNDNLVVPTIQSETYIPDLTGKWYFSSGKVSWTDHTGRSQEETYDRSNAIYSGYYTDWLQFNSDSTGFRQVIENNDNVKSEPYNYSIGIKDQKVNMFIVYESKKEDTLLYELNSIDDNNFSYLLVANDNKPDCLCNKKWQATFRAVLSN